MARLHYRSVKPPDASQASVPEWRQAYVPDRLVAYQARVVRAGYSDRHERGLEWWE